jgi:hypothetical protein
MPVFGYHPLMPAKIFKSGQPICAAVVFNPVSDFKPIAFGVELNGLRYRYKVKTIRHDKDKFGFYTFDCEYIDFGRVIPIRLIYDVTRCQWTVG